MLDHVFTDAIGALRESFESAMLERQAFEERFQVDVLLGDSTWETSYALPGEGLPPRARADISLEWSTWSQTAYRNWYNGDATSEPPRIDIEIVLRIQRLVDAGNPEVILAVLPEESPAVGQGPLIRSGPTVEAVYDNDLEVLDNAVEVSYEGVYELEEESLADGGQLDKDFSALGGWICATLVKLGDLPFVYRPPDEADIDE